MKQPRRPWTTFVGLKLDEPSFYAPIYSNLFDDRKVTSSR